MLTPQEVSNRAFTKAPFNGYNMAMVDEFLDELTEDYTALYKENAALKAKMKVMVEKVEEYRATEDSMRSALLAAQRMADSIVQEAEARRDAVLAEAEAEAREVTSKARQEVRDLTEEARREAHTLEQRIRIGRRDMARFIAASRELCNKELSFLEKLPQIQIDLVDPSAGRETEDSSLEESARDSFSSLDEKARDAFGSVADEFPSALPEARTPERGDSGSRPDRGDRGERVETASRFRASGRRFKLEELKLGRRDESRRTREDAIHAVEPTVRLAGEEA